HPPPCACPGAHPDLHSFPTRRSSDLPIVQPVCSLIYIPATAARGYSSLKYCLVCKMVFSRNYAKGFSRLKKTRDLCRKPQKINTLFNGVKDQEQWLRENGSRMCCAAFVHGADSVEPGWCAVLTRYLRYTQGNSKMVRTLL